jgi:O-antigen/teichoic acid export membrane protein
MGIVQKDAIRTSVISMIGLLLGYLNKAFLFIVLFSTAQVGLINILLSVGLLFAQFANLGTIYSTWRFFPFFRNPIKKHYGFLLANTLVVAIGVLLCIAIVFLLQHQIIATYQEKSPLFVQYYKNIIPLGIAMVFFQLYENHLRGMQNNVLPVVLQEIVLRLFTSALLLIYFLQLIEFQQFVTLYVWFHFIPALYLVAYLWRKDELSLSFSSIQIPKRFQKIMLSYTGFSYLNSLATLLVISMDALMIAKYEGMEATGVYTTMVLLISAVIFPFRAVMRVSSPLVARQWKERNLIGMNELYQKSSSIGLLLALSGFLLIWLPIDQLFEFIPTYKAGKWVFFFLMLGRIVDMYFGLNAVIFSTSKKYKFDLFFTVMLIACVFFCNLWLIPLYGIVGAAISTGAAFVVYNILRAWFIAVYYNLYPHSSAQNWLIVWSLLCLLLYYSLDHFQLFRIFSSTIVTIALKELFIVVCFFLPIYWLNLEPESVTYIRTIVQKWRKKS